MDDKGQRGTTQDGFRVVCLCGSAGALEACRKILRALPADTGMAFVIATHRGMEHAELLPRLLAEVTGMPVTEIQEGLRLEPNRIFLMPPHMHMTMAGPVLHRQPRVRTRGWPISINAFLCSLAETIGPLAVAVILSGMGDDGSAGLKPVKDAGGVIFAQSDAAEDSMPRQAIKTGCVDSILPAAEIGRQLLSLTAPSLAWNSAAK